MARPPHPPALFSPPLGGGKLLGPQWLDRDCDQAVLEDWVFRAHHVATFLSLVIHQGFLLLRSSLKLATLVPERQVDPQREFASVLDVLSVIYVNSHLPQERRLSWRLLFATELHGNSFAQLCGRIAHGGPCLVLLEDSDGHVFGGFASCSWEVKPQFQGETGLPEPHVGSAALLASSGPSAATWKPLSLPERVRCFFRLLSQAFFSRHVWEDGEARCLWRFNLTDFCIDSGCCVRSEKAMAPHSSTLAWKIPWMEEPGGLQSMGLLESDTTERLHFHFSLSCIGEGNGNPLQCSCLENPRDGGAWWATVCGVAQSRTRLTEAI